VGVLQPVKVRDRFASTCRPDHRSKDVSCL
jgi:hypothetical protein